MAAVYMSLCYVFYYVQTTFKVQVSYYEIYKEKIFDLLASTKHKSKTKVANFDYGVERVDRNA